MKLTLNWLKNHIQFNSDISAQKIATKLTEIGFELEEMIDQAESLSGFKVAKILETSPHPDADKLKLCKVQAGENEIIDIVCGAQNAREGIYVVLAPVGTKMPEGFKIKKSKIRGHESHGMLCSETELQIGKDSDGIMELNATSAQIGKNFASEFGYDDVIFDVSITPNRGDALSIVGLARELAACGFGILKTLEENFHGSFDSKINIEITHKACQNFSLIEMKNVKNCPSPAWLQERLEKVDITPISALVDITNYVAHTLGHPMHAYDASKIEGNKIIARSAKNNETFATFSGDEITFQNNELVIADANKIISFAGIIGDKFTGCSLETTHIYLECANFNADEIAKASRKHKIHTEASHKFERNIDHENVEISLKMAASLIQEICGGEPSNSLIIGDKIANPAKIEFTFSQFEKLTGVKIQNEKAIEILTNLGFEIEKIDAAKISVTPPSWRQDVTIWQDLVEEIIRIYGYENLNSQSLLNNNLSQRFFSPKQRAILTARRKLAARGMFETLSFAFFDREKNSHFAEIDPNLVLANPISAELNHMRPSILPNLLDIAAKNVKRNIKNLAIFEIGSVYENDEIIGQKEHISGLRMGSFQRKTALDNERKVDAFDAKSDFLAIIDEFGFAVNKLKFSQNEAPSYYHPGKKAAVKIGKTIIGYFGEIHPSIPKHFQLKAKNIVAFEIFADLIPIANLKKGKKPPMSVSNFQASTRDFAFNVSDCKQENLANSMISAAISANPTLIKQARIFDRYESSIALEITMQSDEKTLSEQEIDDLYNKVIQAIESKTGAKFKYI